ncbi:MAG: hypothetical protein F6J86_08115 [Symploca sp. SIO1B1]|nr:hypothetical protein [Symploca sp. SIO1B1]
MKTYVPQSNSSWKSLSQSAHSKSTNSQLTYRSKYKEETLEPNSQQTIVPTSQKPWGSMISNVMRTSMAKGSGLTLTPQPSRQSVVQRHPLKRPTTLEQKPIEGTKQTWTSEEIFPEGDLLRLKQALLQLIPNDANPSPQERVDALTFHDHQNPMDMPGGKENAGNAAKVTDTGEVHLNNTLDDYYNTDGSPNKEKIKSTIVHESLHAVSANHTGFQNYSSLVKEGSVQNAPDEAVTDYFALQVYQSVFPEKQDFNTGYWVPVEAIGATAPTKEKGELLRAQHLPADWSGEMIGVLKNVLGIDEEKLKGLYFKNSDEFGQLIEGKEEEIRTQWSKLIDKQALETHGVLTKVYKEVILEEVIQDNLQQLKDLDENQWSSIVKDALKQKNVPKVDAKFGSPFSDAFIKKKVKERVH